MWFYNFKSFWSLKVLNMAKTISLTSRLHVWRQHRKCFKKLTWFVSILTRKNPSRLEYKWTTTFRTKEIIYLDGVWIYVERCRKGIFFCQSNTRGVRSGQCWFGWSLVYDTLSLSQKLDIMTKPIGWLNDISVNHWYALHLPFLILV